jgi:hypothetical protein
MSAEIQLAVLDHFRLASGPVKVTTYGEGHIHETFLVETQDHKPDYILQKINHSIFRDIPGMMSNIEIVIRHFKQKFNNFDGYNPDIESLTLIYTKSGQSFFRDDGGNFWRMYVFIPGTVTYQKMSDPALGFEAGKAIGQFQALLTDLKTELIETIPDFHNIDWRIRQYRQTKHENPAGRVSIVEDDSLFVEQRFDRMSAYYRSLKEKAVVRATHNDTKLNNILFDTYNKALCLIDLDTVMPGYVHFDYGDALRTMANTALEDERDLSKVMFNFEVYHSFTRGYLQEAEGFLTPEELALLPYAPIYLTIIIGLRFLTDFINGDVYYRIHHPEHNLERARVQFKLVEEMEKSINFEFL